MANHTYTAAIIHNTKTGNYAAFISEMPEVTVQADNLADLKVKINKALKYVKDYNLNNTSIQFSDVQTIQ